MDGEPRALWQDRLGFEVLGARVVLLSHKFVTRRVSCPEVEHSLHHGSDLFPARDRGPRLQTWHILASGDALFICAFTVDFVAG